MLYKIATAMGLLALNGATAIEPLTSVDGALFFEGFGDSWKDRWTVSKNSDFQGEWKHEEYASPAGIPGDKGLVVGSEAKKHAVSTVFAEPVDPKGKGLVVQFELQMKKELTCGGAYIKLLTASDELSTEGFTGESPYTIMFGPDKCGSTNKVHFILRHKSPKTGEWEEKHLAGSILPKLEVGQTHLYTAVIGADNSVAISIDNIEQKSADLLSSKDFAPPVNPPSEIDDPEDHKPTDWVDEAKIDDPESSKPDDWDEDAPYQVPDPDEKKPEGWLDDVDPKEQVPDTEAKAPDDWDAEEDGEWEAPLIDNPACESPNPGCGEWKAKQISNPAYKGKWYAPKIDNPDYKGTWMAKQIANPDYFKDEQPHAMAPIGGIGIELWTMNDGALFDNIVIGHDVEVASKAAETFTARYEAEQAAKKADDKDDADEKKDEL
jgi:calnexin